ncbi:hypothetical protein Salat_1670400 [Sesamum alatum]|uniref:Uncharacterized protein n=1 Tax=Sesamum alatum TaxID=300844 RepID=A0AAE1Y7Z3_9LAMI|nr:hypothetical protein Salat_1670400 [Sesamum alatum]
MREELLECDILVLQTSDYLDKFLKVEVLIKLLFDGSSGIDRAWLLTSPSSSSFSWLSESLPAISESSPSLVERVGNIFHSTSRSNQQCLASNNPGITLDVVVHIGGSTHSNELQ